jgi:hypothetical protein
MWSRVWRVRFMYSPIWCDSPRRTEARKDITRQKRYLKQSLVTISNCLDLKVQSRVSTRSVRRSKALRR